MERGFAVGRNKYVNDDYDVRHVLSSRDHNYGEKIIQKRKTNLLDDLSIVVTES